MLAQRLFDVLAVVTAVGPLGSIKRKSDQSELIRRDITLLDSTCGTPAPACTGLTPHVPFQDAVVPGTCAAGTLTLCCAGVCTTQSGPYRNRCHASRRAKTVRSTLWGRLAEEQGSALEAAAADAPVVAISSCRATDFDGEHRSCGPNIAQLHWAHYKQRPQLCRRVSNVHATYCRGTPCACCMSSHRQTGSLRPCLASTGVSISTGRASEVRVDPDLPEAVELRQWYDTIGRGAVTAPAGEGLANGRSASHCKHLITLCPLYWSKSRHGRYRAAA